MGAKETIWRLAEIQHGVVSRPQLWDRGIGGDELYDLVEDGLLIRITPQVMRIAGAPINEASRLMASVLDSPGVGYLSHHSAAAWWGIPGYTLRHPVHTIIPWQGARKRRRLTVVHYHCDLPTDHLRILNDVRVVSPALTIFLLAGSQHPGRTERALDNAWSMNLVTYRNLHDLLNKLAARGRNGIRVIRKLLADRPPDYIAPQTGLEARAQRLAGEVGVALRRQVDSGGNDWIGRVDFRIEDSAKIIEVLSQRYHGSLLDRRADEARFARLSEAGFQVLTLWDSDVWENPDKVRDMIARFSRANIGSNGDNGARK